MKNLQTILLGSGLLLSGSVAMKAENTPLDKDNSLDIRVQNVVKKINNRVSTGDLTKADFSDFSKDVSFENNDARANTKMLSGGSCGYTKSEHFKCEFSKAD